MESKKEKKKPKDEPPGSELIIQIIRNFDRSARQLRRRYNNRTPYEINDEYDVQDLIQSLLNIFFDDIRPEENTPSYAGKSSRMDFLLKNELVVIETKKTRKGLGAKELGTELIEDIERYQAHPSCKTLVCFVYDPEERVSNPEGLANDLSRSQDNFKVKVIIRPKRI